MSPKRGSSIICEKVFCDFLSFTDAASFSVTRWSDSSSSSSGCFESVCVALFSLHELHFLCSLNDDVDADETTEEAFGLFLVGVDVLLRGVVETECDLGVLLLCLTLAIYFWMSSASLIAVYTSWCAKSSSARIAANECGVVCRAASV